MKFAVKYANASDPARGRRRHFAPLFRPHYLTLCLELYLTFTLHSPDTYLCVAAPLLSIAKLVLCLGLASWLPTCHTQYRPKWPSPYLQREIFLLNLEDGYFGCQVNESTDFLQLFELSKLCDGTPQCFLGSDELSLELKCTDRSEANWHLLFTLLLLSARGEGDYASDRVMLPRAHVIRASGSTVRLTVRVQHLTQRSAFAL